MKPYRQFLIGAATLLVLLICAGQLLKARSEAARRRGAAAMISNIVLAVEGFKSDNTRYPTTAEGLDALVHCPPGLETTWHQRLDAVPEDKWGHTLIYKSLDADPRDFNLIHPGPDGIEGTPDDVDKNSR